MVIPIPPWRFGAITRVRMVLMGIAVLVAVRVRCPQMTLASVRNTLAVREVVLTRSIALARIILVTLTVSPLCTRLRLSLLTVSVV